MQVVRQLFFLEIDWTKRMKVVEDESVLGSDKRTSPSHHSRNLYKSKHANIAGIDRDVG